MNRHSKDAMHSSNKYRRGQSIIFVTMSTTLIFGVTAMVWDFGMVYRDQNALNASTQAAALAGAEAMAQPGATTATTTAAVTSFSSQPGNENASAYLPGATLVSGYPSFSCLTTLENSFNINCYGPSTSNALVVKQQATVPLYFLNLFGAGSVTLNASATASMKGASAGPFNVAIILDTTRSMTSTDSDSNCKSTRIACAEAGIQVLLKNTAPCLASEASCGAATLGMVSNSVDRISLFVFPAVTTGTSADESSCSGTVATAAYADPLPSTSTYQIVNFASDYRTSDTATSLNTSSGLIDAVMGKTGTPCIQVLGGYGTYYAQAIYAAQTYLAAEKLLFPTSQNAMILVSDGDATATSSDMPGASTTSTTYMSDKQECQQAITAAKAATTAGTRVYSVAYGAEASGCTSDTNPTITPCDTMEQIASTPGYFFSDYTATGGTSSCISASQPVTSLSEIFQVIAGDLSIAKLIPNNTQ